MRQVFAYQAVAREEKMVRGRVKPIQCSLDAREYRLPRVKESAVHSDAARCVRVCVYLSMCVRVCVYVCANGWVGAFPPTLHMR